QTYKAVCLIPQVYRVSQFFGSVQKTCGYVKSDQVLNNVHAIWVAEIKENKVNLWHIHPDTKENRNKFGI
ncbi:hypothetical protein, partial [Parabacteroides distasonis]|uniref:hypothetical protein n=1 Tax=Parabacteroides distasonis TaxID=823 RepID=UPI0022E4B260